MARYLVNTGLNYGPTNRRAEPGDVVTDLPGESVRHLLERGHIEPADADSALEAPMTKAQLRDMAEDLGIDVPARATKDEIEELLESADSDVTEGEEE